VFSVISFRTLVAAIAFFGVSGRAALSAGYAPSTSFILAVIVGVAASWIRFSARQIATAQHTREAVESGEL